MRNLSIRCRAVATLKNCCKPSSEERYEYTTVYVSVYTVHTIQYTYRKEERGTYTIVRLESVLEKELLILNINETIFSAPLPPPPPPGSPTNIYILYCTYMYTVHYMYCTLQTI